VWAYTRPGIGEFWPEDIDTELCDVIYYGLGNILNDTYEVCSWDPWFPMAMTDGADGTIRNCVQERDGIAWPPGCVTDAGLEYCHYDGIRRTVALKEKRPDLKVLFSVGGWTAGGWIFSQMAESQVNRAKFIKSLIHFIKYFGLDGVDLDWEYPGYDMLPEVPSNPEDKQHFTLLVKEIRQAFDVDGYLLTFAAAPDPYKANNAFELDKIVDSVDWLNLMTYDYSGPWDNFTGIEAPLYGRWGEGYVGHPKYQFNIHETMQYYFSQGFPPEKIALGIHTESKGWVLANQTDEASGIYCPTYGSPNMTYSRQEGWLYYYEILQFWHNETVEDPRWSDVVLGRDQWTIYDHDNGKVDGCYLSPYMYQGKYWISYDDEDSVDVKVRYANHYGLKGAFVWEVDNDNFMGMYGKPKFTILQAINNAVVGGKGLEPHEILGAANDNKQCSPQAPFCDTVFPPRPVCVSDNECNNDTSVVCNMDYDNCFYCDAEDGECKPGCSDDQNCPDEAPMCSGDHTCKPSGFPVLTRIAVNTKSCSGCSNSNVEEGLQLHLVGRYGAECSTNSLDNTDQIDYTTNHEAVFNGTILGGKDDHGLGGCNNYDLNVGLTAGTATWTGDGSWTPQTDKPICINFYDPEDNKPTCCCNLGQQSLSSSDGATDLSCSCFMP
jgi:chitinase